MTKEQLEKMRALRTEIKLLEADLYNLPQTKDSVTGSMTEYPYIQTTIQIAGTDEAAGEALKKKIARRLAQLRRELTELEEWLNNIEDPEMRVILRMYYGLGKTQEAIGKEIGYNRETVCRKIRKFAYDNESRKRNE